ncbi:MAG: hypothetical protein IKN04_07960 [Clostridia bacterium]|nr:hypothetical protein [Clostridia bacterium]
MSIMKKIFAMILIAALCLSGTVLAEEAPAVTASDYLGEWVDLDGACNIDITEHTDGETIDGYVANVEMPIIEKDGLCYVVWSYACVWDDETQTMKSTARFVGKGDYDPDSEEEITDSSLDYTAATFRFDEEGRLAWSDENETADDGLLFVRPIGWGESVYASFRGEWVECETHFTQMTIEENPVEGLDVEIVSPLTHGAYIFKSTVQYDADERCFTYDKGKFWDVPITEEENPELGEEKIAGTSGIFAFVWEEDRLVLTWTDDSQPDREVRFERAETDAEPAGAAAFEGVWQCDRATIAMYWEEEGFKVLITWGSSAWEHSEWEYSCYYHEENNTVVSVPFGIRTEYVYGDNGELVSATEAYNDGEAVFSLDEEGKLIWLDEKENAGDGMRFEKIPEEPADLTFATIGDAMNAEGYTGIAGGDDEHYVAVVELDGAYLRVVAKVDDEARRLGDATLDYVDADTLEAAFAAYNAYIETLPIAYEEEITAQPLTQEELDALAGKTLLELEEAGYESSSSHMGEDDAAIYTVSYGLFEYDLLLNGTYTEYMEHNDSGYIGDLTVKSAALAGISRNAVEMRYHADGTYDEENDSWAEFNGIMEMITNALSSENPEEAIQALIEAMPEQAEEIQAFAEIISAMTEQSEE